MLKLFSYTVALTILIHVPLPAQQYINASGNIKVFIVKDPYTDSRTGPERVSGPEILESGGLTSVLSNTGFP